MILALIGFIGLCLLVGAANGAIMQVSTRTWYLSLPKPPGALPLAAFAAVWGVAYVMLGVAGWLVWRRTGAGRALRLWGWQLLCNAFWIPAVFGARSLLLGLLVLSAINAMLLATAQAFARVSRPAAGLMLVYLGWMLYAFYLNVGVWWLNPG